MNDHVCMCYDCSAHKLPPRGVHVDVREALLDGHFRSGSFPSLESVTIDGVVHRRFIRPVREFQLGREPWALVISGADWHRCKSCDGHRTCLSLIFPKTISYVVAEHAREQFERAKARNTSWTFPGECEDCHADAISYHGNHPSLCRACAETRSAKGIPW